MTRSTDDQEKRLTELKKEVPKRGFDRYASRLKNISELPIELQSAAVTTLAARETPQTILVFYKLTLKNEAVEVWRRAWVQQGGAWEELPVQQA